MLTRRRFIEQLRIVLVMRKVDADVVFAEKLEQRLLLHLGQIL
jgi:hypothetical protein